MAYVRVGQLTAELNTLLDVSLYGGGSTNPTIATAQYKTGTRAYALAAASEPFGLGTTTFGRTYRAGFWIRHHGGTSTPTLAIIQIGTSFIKVLWNVASNTFDVYAGYERESFSLLLKDSIAAGTFSTIDTWRHIGICLDYQCTDLDGYFAFYVDGVEKYSYTGAATNGMAIYPQYSTALVTDEPAGIFGPGYQGAGAWTTVTYVDDFYVDSAAGESYAPVPAKRFLFSLADGAGVHHLPDWTPADSTNISQVDDAVTSEHDGDATYVKALAADLIDTYTTADITLPVDHAIIAAIPIAIVRKTDAVDCQLSLVADDGTNVTTGTAQALPLSYGAVFERLALQPDGSAWNETDFNGMEFGFKSAGTFA